MNTETLFNNIHQGFRITVGATAMLIETLQDPSKRSQTFSTLQSEFIQKADEWASKGEITELEGRRLVEEWLNQLREDQAMINRPTTVEVDATASDRNLKAEIQELTEQLANLRTELEQMRHHN